MKAIDLFCGGGGFSLGFELAGWSIVGANDADKAAEETFRLNFPNAKFFGCPIGHVSVEMLRNAAEISQGDIDCVIGGPPCQSFSYNNHHRSSTDERARLFTDYLRIVEGLAPKTLVMENVPGMRSIGGGALMEEITESLEAIGYDCEYRILRAEQFGVPQLRKRLIFIGSRVGPAAELFPEPTHWSNRFYSERHENYGIRPRTAKQKLVSIQSAIGDLPLIENGEGKYEMDYPSKQATTRFQRWARLGSRTLRNHVCHNLGPLNLRRIKSIPPGGNWRNIPRELLTAGMRRANLTDHTKRYGRLCWDGLASTILTKCDPHWGAYIHPAHDRTITVREAARLQGFPDRFTFADGSLSNQYLQIGNAVPVPLAHAIAQSVSKHLEGRESKIETMISRRHLAYA